MRARGLSAAAAAALAFALAPAAAAAGAPTPRVRPFVSLAAAPAHVRLSGPARRSIRVTNAGARAVVVDVRAAGFALDAAGRPVVLARDRGGRQAGPWLRLVPATIALRPGGSAVVAVTASPPRGASPGDHPALVLLTTRPRPGAAIAVRMRIGVTVVVRVPGAIVHRLELRSVRIRRSGVLRLVVANRGNVAESIRHGALEVLLLARRTRPARLRPPARELLPGTRAVFLLRYPARLRGRATAHVALACCGGRTLRRSLRVRL